MLQLLNPIWLFSLAAIAVPVIIHLWNIKEGKTLKIGSIALLGESSRQNARSLRLNERLLLLLRCLLLALLALLLATPVWRSAGPALSKGWVLLEQPDARVAYQKFQPEIDSLVQAGYQLHYFTPGFPKTTTPGLLADTISADTARFSHWALLQLLEQQVPAKLPVRLYTANRLSRFTGNRPRISFPLQWKTYVPADSVTHWLQDAFLTASDSVRITVGTSTPSATSFKQQTLLPTGNHPLFQFGMQNGVPMVRLKDGTSTDSILVDTSAIRIALFTGQYPDDARYLQAGIDAVKAYSGRKIVLSSFDDPARIPAGQQWIFWLSDRPFPKAAADSARVFLYQPGNSQPVANEIVRPTSGEKISLLKRITWKDGATPETLWEDGFGDPLLTRQLEAKMPVYRFYSHFNPVWNDLVWSSEFPEWMMRLLIPHKAAPAEKDRRALSAGQYFPDTTAAITGKTTVSDPAIPLDRALWILIICLFSLERWLSYKQQPITHYA